MSKKEERISLRLRVMPNTASDTQILWIKRGHSANNNNNLIIGVEVLRIQTGAGTRNWRETQRGRVGDGTDYSAPINQSYSAFLGQQCRTIQTSPGGFLVVVMVANLFTMQRQGQIRPDCLEEPCELVYPPEEMNVKLASRDVNLLSTCYQAAKQPMNHNEYKRNKRKYGIAKFSIAKRRTIAYLGASLHYVQDTTVKGSATSNVH